MDENNTSKQTQEVVEERSISEVSDSGAQKSVECSENTQENGQNAGVSEEKINQLARHYRHIGFAIFGGLAALLSGFLIYTAVSGYIRGDITDPFTGEKVVAE